MPKEEDENLEALVTKAKRGGSEGEWAFNSILSILSTELKKISTKYYISGADAEDVLQEARIGVWKAVEDWHIDGGMSFKNFAINLCCKRHVITAMATANRKKYAILNKSISYETPVIIGDSDNDQLLSDFIEDPSAELINHFIAKEENEIQHRKILNKLTPMEKSIYLCYMKDISYKEIATMLNIKTKAVDNALMRIRKKATEIEDDIEDIY